MSPARHIGAGTATRDGYDLWLDPESAGWSFCALRVMTLAPGGSLDVRTGGSEWVLLPLNGGCTVEVEEAVEVVEVVEVEAASEAAPAAGAASEPGRPARAGADRPAADRAAADRAAADRAAFGPPPADPPGLGGSAVGAEQARGHALFTLHGRADVFSGTTDFCYLPRDSRAVIGSPRGGRFALAGARCERRLPARRVPASAVPVELRGAGTASRQVNNFAAADVFACDRLIAVEVLTPGGNWSSYPPHKHDEEGPHETRLEEIYYYELRGGPAALGYQRVYPSPAGCSDVLAEVRPGDAVLIPDGWHGPSMAVPGYDMYYLNVMAGPGTSRAWLISDDPAHAWVRDTWRGQPVDERLPLYEPPPPADGEEKDGEDER